MAEDTDKAGAKLEDAGPGEPGHYTPPDPNAGITRTPSNEVVQRVKHAAGTADDTDYESHTVPELREMAEERGIVIESGARKDEIIDALKKG